MEGDGVEFGNDFVVMPGLEVMSIDSDIQTPDSWVEVQFSMRMPMEVEGATMRLVPGKVGEMCQRPRARLVRWLPFKDPEVSCGPALYVPDPLPVVVAFDQDLVAIQSRKDGFDFFRGSVESEVTQEERQISRLHNCVVVVYEGFVHLLRRLERSATVLNDPSVIEVRV